MAGTCLQYCIVVLAAFGVVVDAECSDLVEFVVDNKTFNNASTLYKPSNIGGVVHCLRCDRDFMYEVIWFNSDGPPGNEISPCDDNMLVPCTKTVGAPRNIDRDLVFSTFVTGTYKCGGTTNQETINIIAIEITTHPSSTTVIALQDVTLNCSASLDNVTYSWHRDGGSVPSRSSGQNNNTLTIRKATPPDEGIYYCMANKEGISVESNRARVKVDDKLSISVRPTNPVIGERGNAQLTATASGVNKKNFVYQWRKRGSSILPNKVSGVNEAMLTIPNLVKSDEGVYYCNVTNQWGNSVRSDDVSLRVAAGLPMFREHPQNQSVNNNNKVTFNCFANGSDSLTITWEKDRRSYTSGVTQVTTHSNGVSSSLTLKRARVGNSGKYRCRATNVDEQSAISDEAELIILPQILTNPDDDAVFIGQSTQLTCNALGTDIVYQWMKDGVVVSGANSNMLRITNIKESDEGVYKCVASNKGGQVESNPATVTVYGPPSITTHPRNVNIPVMASTTLTCSATGDGTLMYSWERRSGSSWTTINNANNPSYTTNSNMAVGQYTYRCVVRNEAGSVVSDRATVNVYGPPEITDHPTGGDVPTGRSITLMCRASGLGTLVYFWERKHGGRWTTVGNNNRRHTISTTLTMGQYMYRCNVSNEAGSDVSDRATVNVYGPPTITTYPTSQLTTAGMSVTLNCEGTGRGSITYQWQSRNINGRRWNDSSNNRILVVGNLQDSQQYRCVVSNEAGETTSNVTTISVLKITAHPSNKNVIALQNVTLRCSASVDDVTYSWHRDGGSVPSKSRGQNSNTLTIRRTTPHDEGDYYCMANKEGISVESNRATVRVDDQLQLSIIVSPTNRIGEGVTARLIATASGVNKNQFEYQWENKSSNNFAKKVSGINGEVLTIPDLVESDEGVYYCNVTNQWGRSVRSNEVTLTVIAGLPVFWRYPQNQSINNNDKVIFDCFANGSNSVVITWEKDRNLYTSGVTQTHSNGVSSSLTLNRARVADSGKYQCRATNADGESITSNEAQLIILPLILTNPEDVTVFIGQSTQLICNALGTDIVYQWMKDGIVVSGANSNMSRITNTEESDEGVYKCVVSNKGGLVESNPATITVYGPPVIQELPQQVHVVLGEEFQITCTANNDQDAPKNLMFSWETSSKKRIQFNETTTDEDDSRTASSTLHISSVTNNDGVQYTCSVRNGDGSTVTTFGLIVEVPSSPPRSLNIIHVNVSSLEMTWNRPRHRRGEIEFYSVYFNGSDQPVQVVNVTNFTGNYTLDNLRPYTEYSVYVTAVRLIGTTGRPLEGKKSDIVTARTLAGEPIVKLDEDDKANLESLINNSTIISNSDVVVGDNAFSVYLPTISNENGPFSYLYIIVAINENVTDDIKEMTTKDLLEESNKNISLFYVAAVVNASQYVPGYRMSYILGAGDNTTDPNGHVFYNREGVQGRFLVLYRVFSANSTAENEIFTTTDSRPIKPSLNGGGSSSGGGGSAVGVVVGVIVALLIAIAIIIAVLLFLYYYKKTYLKYKQNDLSQVVPSDSGIQMKEKEMKEEKAKPLPVVNPVALSTQVPSDNLLMEVVTSAGQPTTLFVELPYADESEITWKKDNKPSNYPVLPDGSLYITNTNLNDGGVYTVTATGTDSTMSEKLHLEVINPQLPSEMSQRKHIKVDNFPEHVAMMRSKKNEQFEADYESMVVDISFSQHTAKLHINASKNRYKNIVPYDHSRVVLSLQGHKPGSDYVNASFIDGYKEPKAYIAAQGPVAGTVDTFWRMIWEQNVATIVMVTRLVEDAKVKCHQYWPSNTEPATYGDYKVTVLKQEEIAKYCIRNFTIEKVINQKHEVRSVTQFHFTVWPDHGVPKYSTALLEFQKRIDKHHKRKTGKPMLVHCSAGVGRTGTFIAIDSEIQHIRHENIVDVYNCVLRLRYWRNFMVQSSAQYTLIHTALLDYIACGDTSITAPTKSVQDKVSELSAVAPSAKKTGFELQFEKLTKASPKESEFTYATASSSKNKAKNRNKKFLPPDNCRVQLAPVGNKPDYINACYIDGYRHSKEFIVGPGPMESTSADFWRMLWENKSCSIIMLGELVENGEEASFKYWPEMGQNVEFGTFVVETISEEPLSESVIKRVMKITNAETKASRTITQLQYVGWPQKSCPSSPVPIVDMIEIVERVQRRTGNGPIIVHCSDGVGRSGTFCALVVSINRFKAEQMVDVFQTIITMRTQKPQFVTNADQYKFIHNALIAMLQRFANYDNFSEGATM